MKTITARGVVYSAINMERDYQDKKWNEYTTESGGQHSAAEFLLYISHYVDKARTLAATTPDPKGRGVVLHEIRKIAALAVCCMEQNGVAWRK